MLAQKIRGGWESLKVEDVYGRRWVLVHWMHYPRTTLTPEDREKQKKDDEEFARSFHAWLGASSLGVEGLDGRRMREFIARHRLDVPHRLWLDKYDPVHVLRAAVRMRVIHAILESDGWRGGGGAPPQDQNPYATVQKMMGKPPRTSLGNAQPFEYVPDALGDDSDLDAGVFLTPAEEAECEIQLNMDMAECSAWYAAKPSSWGTCRERAMQRYANCLRGKPIA